MKKPFNVALALFILLFVGGIFYWWQWRPAHIRSVCANETTEKLGKAGEEGARFGLTDWERYYEMLFQTCINKRGLK